MSDDAPGRALRTRHVFPTIGRFHDLSDSCECWCDPVLSVICPACERAVPDEDDPCWRCGDESHAPAARDDVEPYDYVVVFHRPTPGGGRIAGDHLMPIHWIFDE